VDTANCTYTRHSRNALATGRLHDLVSQQWLVSLSDALPCCAAAYHSLRWAQHSTARQQYTNSTLQHLTVYVLLQECIKVCQIVANAVRVHTQLNLVGNTTPAHGKQVDTTAQ
jgi:hypothetical protein